MQFFSSAIDTLQTLVVALGAGLGVWGVVNLLEGYGSDNPGSKSQGMKQLWRGGQVLAVPPAYTSQRCACCGHTAKENRLSQSKFVCQVCGYTANADVNGARNILAAGHAVLACGGMVQSGRPLKQEPEAEQSAVTH